MYKQLAQRERYQIYALLKAGQTHAQIAKLLNRSKSTISREVRRNKGKKGYRPAQAHKTSLARHLSKRKKRFSQLYWDQIRVFLEEDWSPEQISLWLKKYDGIQVSHEWIYQYIVADKDSGGILYKHLRCQKKRRKRYGSHDRRGRLLDRVSINQRPEIVDSKSRIGDWEVDTIIGKNHKQAIVSITERRSRLTLIQKVEKRSAECVTQAIEKLLLPLKGFVHTITSDNGGEFAMHKRISERLNADFYFANPYSSWERGLNENTNGLIRQYFPKGSDFSGITQAQIDLAMLRLNSRPRKGLGSRTPAQVFWGIEPAVALRS